ncbi:MAG: stage 0 sporulation protein [Patescibacteria group bacterium]|nr:stage 0 sporulation protein [Patescibacteria group bacterium]
MDKEIYIKAKSDNKIFKAKLGNLEVSPGDEILFETEQSQDVGYILGDEYEIQQCEQEDGQNISIIRKLTPKDKEKMAEREIEAKATLLPCEEKIKKHGLEMNLLGADLSYDGKKLTFYFTSPGRVDFRSLVPDLASTFKKLIRLQQIGARDKAKCLGSVGRCGQKVCCKRFLKGDLESVTLEMAYDQNLGQMGSNRVTGACGKLMCCLKYELDHYQKTKKSLPEIGSELKTAEGTGKVLSQNILKEKVMVELNEDKKIVEVDC